MLQTPFQKVLVEVLKEKNIEKHHIHTLSPTQPNCLTPIVDYLLHDILPDNHKEARKIRIKAPQYTIIWGLYTKKDS